MHLRNLVSMYSMVPCVPGGIPGVIEPFLSKEALKSNSETQNNFIETLSRFSNNSARQKLIISIDGIDNIKLQKELFLSILNDIKIKIPPNVLIIVSSSNYQPEFSNNILLSNFDYDDTKKFVTLNFGRIDRDLIDDIFLKSDGYPVSLGWLWHNYTQNEDIQSLLTRFSREGFLKELEQNFFNKLSSTLSKEEQNVLKICANIEVSDNLLISELVGINKETAGRILDNFNDRGILEIVDSMVLPDGGMVNFYTD
jgi:hypothetical protein